MKKPAAKTAGLFLENENWKTPVALLVQLPPDDGHSQQSHPQQPNCHAAIGNAITAASDVINFKGERSLGIFCKMNGQQKGERRQIR